MLFEATITILLLMGGFWAVAVWASFEEDTKKVPSSNSLKRKAAA